MKHYAGIGSRETPIDILELFKWAGKFLATNTYVLRSGHAEGADQAFEYGCDLINGEKEIYLPWKGFQKSSSVLIVTDQQAFDIGKQFHPAWDRLSEWAIKLQARNSHQVLGKDLETPSKFIICWTKNGKGQGGTGQAIRIAEYYNIPIFDAGKPCNAIDCKEKLQSFLAEYL